MLSRVPDGTCDVSRNRCIVGGCYLISLFGLSWGIGRPLSGQDAIALETEEMFTIGFDETHLFFGQVGALAMASDGTVLVYDQRAGDDAAVTVLSRQGEIISRWGRRGDGPGELTGGQVAVSVHGDSILIAATARAGFYTWRGDELSRRTTPLGWVLSVALVGGDVFAWTQEPDMEALVRERFSLDLEAIAGGEFPQQRRFGRWGADEPLWRTQARSSRVSGPFRAGPLLATIPGERMVVGYGDDYVLQIIAAPSGDTIGTITRDVPERSDAETEAFLEEAGRYLANPEEAPADWSGIFHGVRPTGSRALGDNRASLPVIRNIFWGPPGVLWIERGLGIADEYAGALESPDESRLWDIIALDDVRPVHLGTVSLPDGFYPHTGNEESIAGLVYDAFGRQAVRVLRVEVRFDSFRPGTSTDWAVSAPTRAPRGPTRSG